MYRAILAGLAAAAMFGSAAAQEVESPDGAAAVDPANVVTAPPAAAPDRLLVMEPNAKIMFITTGGAELRADWTEAASLHLKSHFAEQMADRGEDIVEFDPDAERNAEIDQLLLLYEVVSQSTAVRMPHKGNKVDSNHNLTLGESAALLADAYNADRALFIDHYSQIESSGVFMMQVLVGTATGYVPPSANVRATSGRIIDLKTGDIVATHSTFGGDARDLGESSGIVSRIMNKLSAE